MTLSKVKSENMKYISLKKTIVILVIVFVCELLYFACAPYGLIDSHTIGIILLISSVKAIIMSVAILFGWALYKKLTESSKTKMKIVAGIVFVGSLVYCFLMTEYFPKIPLRRIYTVIMGAGEYTIIIITAILIIIRLVRFVCSKLKK